MLLAARSPPRRPRQAAHRRHGRAALTRAAAPRGGRPHRHRRGDAERPRPRAYIMQMKPRGPAHRDIKPRCGCRVLAAAAPGSPCGGSRPNSAEQQPRVTEIPRQGSPGRGASHRSSPTTPAVGECRQLPFTDSKQLREAQHPLQFPTRGPEAPQGTNRKAAPGRANSRPPKAAAPASPSEQGLEETSRFPAQLHLPATKQEHEVLCTRGTHQFLHCVGSDFTCCDSNLGAHSSNTWGLLRKDQS